MQGGGTHGVQEPAAGVHVRPATLCDAPRILKI